MDYGKLAMMDSERELLRNAPSPVINRVGLVFDTDIAINEEFVICGIAGLGGTKGMGEEAVIFVSLTFSGSVGGAKIDLRINKKNVFRKTQYATTNFVVSATLDKEVPLSIKISRAVKLETVEIMMFGGRILGTSIGDINLATIGGKAAVLSIVGDEVRVCIGSPTPNFDTYSLAGFGEEATIAGIKIDKTDYFAVCYSDGPGNRYISLLDMAGELKGNVRIDLDAAKIIMCSGTSDQLIVGYINKGYAYAAVLVPPNFDKILDMKIEEAANIQFVRDSVPPAVILDKYGKSIIRLAQDELPCTDSIKVAFDCEKV